MADEQKIDDGGAAFPCFEVVRYSVEGVGTERSEPRPGMTTRVWLAGIAMQAVLANPSTQGQIDPESVASTAYAIADALLAAREEGGGDHA